MAPPLLLVLLLLPALAAGHQHPSSYGSSALSEWRPAKASYYAADPEDAIDGACGFGDLGKHGYGMATVGLSTALFERGAACGGCYEVKCVEDLKYCLPGTSIVVTATNFCAPNYGLPADAGGHCNPPNHHFLLPIQAFEKIALWKAGVMPIQYRRVKCLREGGVRFSVNGRHFFFTVLISNVGGAGDVRSVKIKGTESGWISMGRNWGQIWHINSAPLMAAAMDVDAAAGGEKRPSDKELFRSAESGDASMFASLAPADLAALLSLRNEDGRSLLHVAAAAGKPQVVLALAEAGGDAVASVVKAKDEEGWAPIHSAASIGNAQIIDILLERAPGAQVDLTTDGGRTALHYAASKGRLNIAEKLIAQGANVNKKDKFGCTPLHRAASTGNAELCEFLIEEGAEVDAVDGTGQTPLMHAVICEDKGVALLLIRHGADVDVEDKEGYTVLGQASNSFRPILIDAAKAMLEG